MWIIPTKKQIKKELKKISNSFRLRDKEISQQSSKIDENKIKIARLEGVVSVLLIQSKGEKSQSQGSLRKSQSNFETKVIQRIRKSKKALVIAEIRKLNPSSSVIEIFDKIVREREMCSKASFYRYISSLKSQNLIETETKLRLK